MYRKMGCDILCDCGMETAKLPFSRWNEDALVNKPVSHIRSGRTSRVLIVGSTISSDKVVFQLPGPSRFQIVPPALLRTVDKDYTAGP
jgi:hypothetical protein